MVGVAESLQLWKPHPLLCGELTLKLSSIKESLASLSPPAGQPLTPGSIVNFMCVCVSS